MPPDHPESPQTEPADGLAAALPAGSPAAPLPQRAVSRLWVWFVLLLMGVAWGLSFSLAKIAVDGGAHPLGITLWQALLGAVLLIAVALVRRRRIPLGASFFSLYLLCALLGTVVPGVLFFYAAQHVPAGVLSITVTLVPILTVLLSALLGVERLAVTRVLGVLFGMLSVVLLVAPEESLPDPAAAPWVLAACAASACYAAENLVIALRMPPSTNAVSVASGMFVLASLILLPVVIWTGSFVALAWPWGEVEWAIVGMSAISAMAYSLFIYLVDRAGPVFASQTAYVVTLSGVFWGIAIFGESHSLWIWLSLILMLVGLTLVRPRKRPAETAS